MPVNIYVDCTNGTNVNGQTIGSPAKSVALACNPTKSTTGQDLGNNVKITGGTADSIYPSYFCDVSVTKGDSKVVFPQSGILPLVTSDSWVMKNGTKWATTDGLKNRFTKAQGHGMNRSYSYAGFQGVAIKPTDSLAANTTVAYVDLSATPIDISQYTTLVFYVGNIRALAFSAWAYSSTVSYQDLQWATPLVVSLCSDALGATPIAGIAAPSTAMTAEIIGGVVRNNGAVMYQNPFDRDDQNSGEWAQFELDVSGLTGTVKSIAIRTGLALNAPVLTYNASYYQTAYGTRNGPIYFGAAFLVNKNKVPLPYDVMIPEECVAMERSKAYSVGDLRAAADDDGLVYQCYTAGTTSASAVTMNSTIGEYTTDGTAVWKCLRRSDKVPMHVLYDGGGTNYVNVANPLDMSARHIFTKTESFKLFRQRTVEEPALQIDCTYNSLISNNFWGSYEGGYDTSFNKTPHKTYFRPKHNKQSRAGSAGQLHGAYGTKKNLGFTYMESRQHSANPSAVTAKNCHFVFAGMQHIDKCISYGSYVDGCRFLALSNGWSVIQRNYSIKNSVISIGSNICTTAYGPSEVLSTTILMPTDGNINPGVVSGELHLTNCSIISVNSDSPIFFPAAHGGKIGFQDCDFSMKSGSVFNSPMTDSSDRNGLVTIGKTGSPGVSYHRYFKMEEQIGGGPTLLGSSWKITPNSSMPVGYEEFTYMGRFKIDPAKWYSLKAMCYSTAGIECGVAIMPMVVDNLPDGAKSVVTAGQWQMTDDILMKNDTEMQAVDVYFVFRKLTGWTSSDFCELDSIIFAGVLNGV